MKSLILPSNICREKISHIKINAHLKSLRSLRWIALAGVDLKDAVDLMKNEVTILCQLLARHHARLSIDLASKGQALLGPSPAKKDAVPVAFKDSLRIGLF